MFRWEAVPVSVVVEAFSIESCTRLVVLTNRGRAGWAQLGSEPGCAVGIARCMHVQQLEVWWGCGHCITQLVLVVDA